MEHKLIQGGEQYLPFARSRITALRATGLPYATQKYDMGDARVTVRIEPDVDYITIDGAGCNLTMDSGIVDVGFYANPNDPAIYVSARFMSQMQPWPTTLRL